MRILNEVYQILDDCSDSILPIYDIFEKKIFKKLSYNMFSGFFQSWMVDAGCSVECSWSKDCFEKFHRVYNSSFVNKLLYYFDLSYLLSSIQDRFMMVKGVMADIYSYLTYPVVGNGDYTNAIRNSNLNVETIIAELYSVYIYLCSAMDLLTKVVYEFENIEKLRFSNYPKMSSTNKIWKGSYPFIKKFAGSNIFNPTANINEIIDLRNRIIHNGGFDYQLWIYDCFTKDGKIENVIFLPDVEKGHIVKSTNRNNFYSQNRTANNHLVEQVYDFCFIFKETVKQIESIYDTKDLADEVFTKRYLSFISYKIKQIPKEKMNSFYEEVAKINKKVKR